MIELTCPIFQPTIEHMKTKVQIINETASFYNTSNRGVGVIVNVEGLRETMCLYKTDSGNMCAVGRCLLPDSKAFNKLGGVMTVFEDEAEMDSQLQPEYRGHSKRFWTSLQCFHDDDCNWNEDGLTSLGIEELNYLLVRYAK